MIILDNIAIEELGLLEANINGAKKSLTLELINAISYYNDNEGRMLPGMTPQDAGLATSMITGLLERGVSQDAGEYAKKKNENVTPDALTPTSLKQNFEALWNTYPAFHKRDKELAYTYYLRYCRFYDIDEMMRTLRRWINSGDWTEENGKYIPDIARYFRMEKYWRGDPQQDKPSIQKKRPTVVSAAELACIAGEENRNIIRFALRLLSMPSHSLVECSELYGIIAIQLGCSEGKVEAALNEAFRAEIVDKFRNKKKEIFFSQRNKQWEKMTRLKPRATKIQEVTQDGPVIVLTKKPNITPVNFNVDDIDYITPQQLRDFLSVPQSYHLPAGFPELRPVAETGLGVAAYDMYDVQQWLENQPKKLFEFDGVTGQWYPVK